MKHKTNILAYSNTMRIWTHLFNRTILLQKL